MGGGAESLGHVGAAYDGPVLGASCGILPYRALSLRFLLRSFCAFREPVLAAIADVLSDSNL